jgi:hypothetical protein
VELPSFVQISQPFEKLPFDMALPEKPENLNNTNKNGSSIIIKKHQQLPFPPI